MQDKPFTIVIMRHGEPEGDAIFRGITDDPLTEQGWQQMHRALASYSHFDAIFSSPLQRCADFAQSLAHKHALLIEKHSALKEINFGQWEGQLIEQVAINNEQQLAQFWQDPTSFTPPDGEPVLAFQKRVLTFWDALIERMKVAQETSQKKQKYLLLTHGGVQKIILSHVLRMPISAMHNIEVPYACLSTFNVYDTTAQTIVTLQSHGAINGACLS